MRTWTLQHVKVHIFRCIEGLDIRAAQREQLRGLGIGVWLNTSDLMPRMFDDHGPGIAKLKADSRVEFPYLNYMHCAESWELPPEYMARVKWKEDKDV